MEKRNIAPPHHERATDKENRSRNDEFSPSLADGLAITHEQVGDAYREGTIDGLIDGDEGEDVQDKG